MQNSFGEKVKDIFDSITILQAKDSDLKRDNANINGDSPMGAMLQYGANSAKEYNLEYYDENGNLLATEVVTNADSSIRLTANRSYIFPLYSLFSFLTVTLSGFPRISFR